MGVHHPVNISTTRQCLGSILVFVNISFPIGYLYLRKRKLSPCNTNNSTHIQISTAWAQHSARGSLWVAQQGAVSAPAAVPPPCPLDQHHLREAQWHSHPSKGCSSKGEYLQLSFEEDQNSAPSQALAQLLNLCGLSTLPDYARCSTAEAVRVKAHWILTLSEAWLCHRSEEKMIFWAVRAGLTLSEWNVLCQECFSNISRHFPEINNVNSNIFFLPLKYQIFFSIWT